MKRMVIALLLGLVACISFSQKIFADEIEDISKQYALTGNELANFEKAEQVNLKSRSLYTENYTKILENYNDLVKNNDLPDGLNFNDYYAAVTTPAPTDPVAPQYRNVAGSPMAGDILVTDGTSSNGFTGHAGIFQADGLILSIDGYGKKPSTKSIFEWMQSTKAQNPKAWTKVYRPNPAFYRNSAAAQWGKANIRGKNISYGLSGDALNINPTYCSKIAMQCYYYANYGGQNMIVPTFISPYALPNLFLKGTTHIVTWN